MLRGTSTELIRTTAKLVFGAFLFLFVASFLALPCMQADSGLFVSLANGSSAALGVARSSQAVKARSLQGPLSKVALGTPLFVTQMPGATVPTASVQFASAWRTTSTLTASAEAQPSPRIVYRQPLAAASCVEHKLFKPRVNIFTAFEVPAAEHPLRFAVVLVVTLGFGVIATFSHRASVRARPGWLRRRSLPFACSDPPRLPYFAAQRDA